MLYICLFSDLNKILSEVHLVHRERDSTLGPLCGDSVDGATSKDEPREGLEMKDACGKLLEAILHQDQCL